MSSIPFGSAPWPGVGGSICGILVGGALVFLAEVPAPENELLSPLLGLVLTFNGLVLGRHLSNILTFRHLARRPDEVVGEVRLSHSCVISLSIYRLLTVGLPIIFVAIFSQSGLVYGSVAAVTGYASVQTL